MAHAPVPPPALARRITLPLIVLYGLGVTIGAGIYVLIGVSVDGAGIHAPASFLFAAVVMAFSACAFAELSGRHPQSAGEAIYVDAAFGVGWLTRITGMTVILAATVAAAAITLGSSGYIRSLLDLPEPVVVSAIVITMGAIAAYGILESVIFAAILTVIETAGLLVIIGAGLWAHPDILTRLPAVLPPLSDPVALGAVFTTSLVAFFAFIGFDDIVNLAEEAQNPTRTLPLGIAATLVIATLLYFMVVSVAVLTVPHPDLINTGAPISLLFERLTGLPPLAITLIAIVATLNGIVIQIIMGSRVLYGLAKKGRLPTVLARVHPVTRTPVIATVLISGAILALALFFPIGRLAEMTTQAVLVVFVLVNAALVRMKLRKDPVPVGIFTVPLWVPVAGTLTCIALLVGPLFI
ncbi:APC family permease [Pseudogemmobacter sp. W21_MBD1_M6]|uniref:APC family permease n=1 Tax=Pseudogemmobacter sp. W21_MBD1_M6 TaxID=3240271 RepID=UPI003F9C9658